MNTLENRDYALVRKAALESLRRDIDIALHEVAGSYGNARAFQLDCSCAFNRMPREHALAGLKRHTPHLVKSIGQWLCTPFDHIIKFEDGHLEHVTTEDGLPQGCPSAPLSFSLRLRKSIDQFWENLDQHGEFPFPTKEK